MLSREGVFDTFEVGSSEDHSGRERRTLKEARSVKQSNNSHSPAAVHLPWRAL